MYVKMQTSFLAEILLKKSANHENVLHLLDQLKFNLSSHRSTFPVFQLFLTKFPLENASKTPDTLLSDHSRYKCTTQTRY